MSDAQRSIDIPDPFAGSRQLQARLHSLVPGGCHTYAKGDDQYPMLAPGLIARGSGCRVWDVDGREFIEYGMGLRAVTLGHAYPPVIDAVREALALGTNFTRPTPHELECAETFLRSVDADMVKFTKDGSTATTAALKLARAFTGRDMVGICAEHPFFSYDDWFIGTTSLDAGIPARMQALTAAFHYNDLASVEALFAAHRGRVAALFLEPARTEEPRDGFLVRLRQLCDREGALLILDETITGFRWHRRGAQAVYGVVPDLAVFGKALANGFSLSALCGKREIMGLGSRERPDERVFLLSTTHGAETPSLVAAIQTMRIYETQPVVEHLYRQGEKLVSGIEQVVKQRGLERAFRLQGRPCNLIYATHDREGRPSQAFRALLLQETIRRGILMPSLVVSYSHGDEDVDQTLAAIDGALEIYARALEDGVERYLVGPPTRPVFERRFSGMT